MKGDEKPNAPQLVHLAMRYGQAGMGGNPLRLTADVRKTQSVCVSLAATVLLAEALEALLVIWIPLKGQAVPPLGGSKVQTASPLNQLLVVAQTRAGLDDSKSCLLESSSERRVIVAYAAEWRCPAFSRIAGPQTYFVVVMIYASANSDLPHEAEVFLALCMRAAPI